MYTTIKIAALCLLLISQTIVSAQDGFNHYSVNYEVTVSSAPSVVTIQQPAANAATVKFAAIVLYANVATDFYIEQNGTAATSTLVIPVGINGAPATVTKAYTASNVGTGTVIAKYSVPAGSTLPLDAKALYMGSGGGSSTNTTVRSSSVSGVVRTTVLWLETR